jgi:large subunit ribosomal protein L24
MKIRKGDEVIVISGKDKGKVGKVIKALPDEQRVIVDGVAVAKRHTKPSQANPQGGIIEANANPRIQRYGIRCIC